MVVVVGPVVVVVVVVVVITVVVVVVVPVVVITPAVVVVVVTPEALALALLFKLGELEDEDLEERAKSTGKIITAATATTASTMQNANTARLCSHFFSPSCKSGELGSLLLAEPSPVQA